MITIVYSSCGDHNATSTWSTWADANPGPWPVVVERALAVFRAELLHLAMIRTLAGPPLERPGRPRPARQAKRLQAWQARRRARR